jgi:hypothetical protein
LDRGPVLQYCTQLRLRQQDHGYLHAKIHKKIQEHRHHIPNQTQKCPYLPEPKKFGSKAQAPHPPDDTPKLDTKGIKRFQQILGSVFYYAQAVDMMVQMALSSIAINQTMATEKNY